MVAAMAMASSSSVMGQGWLTYYAYLCYSFTERQGHLFVSDLRGFSYLWGGMAGSQGEMVDSSTQLASDALFGAHYSYHAVDVPMIPDTHSSSFTHTKRVQSANLTMSDIRLEE